MTAALAILIGLMTAVGVYLLLDRDLQRIVLGLLVTGSAVNLLVFVAGGVGGAPPLVAEGATAPPAGVANALPQALVLTAIVISFGLVAFMLVLCYRVWRTFGSTDTDAIEVAPGTVGRRPEEHR